MLDISTLKKFDTQKMYTFYDRWPSIARESFESNHDSINFDDINHIVFAGMGGSGAIGDIFASILSKSKIHVNVVKGYHLPATVNENTLVIAISVSGNTIETRTILKAAKNIGSKIISFSAGGKIQEYCLENKIEHRLIPQYHSPRSSFTSYLYSILKVLHNSLKIKEDDIIESINKLEILKQDICSDNLSKNNPSLNLAEWISGIPMIYYPLGLESAAIRFKNSLNENAKLHAITEDVIEACHNGIVSWEKKSDVKPILLEGQDDHFKTKERWKILEQYFRENSIEYKVIKSVKGNILSKLTSMIYLLDYASIYNTVISNTDPTPVKSIDFMKDAFRD